MEICFDFPSPGIDEGRRDLGKFGIRLGQILTLPYRSGAGHHDWNRALESQRRNLAELLELVRLLEIAELLEMAQ